MPNSTANSGLTVELLGAQFPLPVGCGLRRIGDGRPSHVFDEEAATLSPKAVLRRRESFALGRAAAHDALAALGVPVAPVPKANTGEPLWPEGVVGAISHTGGFGVAVVGRSAQYRGIGVDLEGLTRGLDATADHLVCTPAEAAWAAEGADNRRRIMLFCAKEAIFKALYPIEHVWLGLLDAELTWREADGAFDAVLLKPGGVTFPAGYRLRVSCRVIGDMALACTFVLAS